MFRRYCALLSSSDEDFAVADNAVSHGEDFFPDATKSYALFALVNYEFVTPEELLVLGPALAEIESWQGEVWRQLGLHCIERKSWEKAAIYFEQAIAAKVKSMESMPSVRRIEYAQALVELGKRDQAKQLFDSVDVHQLYPRSRRTYHLLRQRLRKDATS